MARLKRTERLTVTRAFFLRCQDSFSSLRVVGSSVAHKIISYNSTKSSPRVVVLTHIPCFGKGFGKFSFGGLPRQFHFCVAPRCLSRRRHSGGRRRHRQRRRPRRRRHPMKTFPFGTTRARSRRADTARSRRALLQKETPSSQNTHSPPSFSKVNTTTKKGARSA